MPSSPENNFSDMTSLTDWTKRLLYAGIALDVLAILSGVLEYRLLNDFKNGVYTSEAAAVAAGEASDLRQRFIGIAQLLTFLVGGVLVLRWIHRANTNARELGAAGMEFTAAWSVGWYFIPFANLWKPFQAMREIWQASSNPGNWKNQPVPGLLGWWWTAWLISGLLGNYMFRLSLKAKEIDELLNVNVITQCVDIAGLLASLLLLSVVSRIHAMQMTEYKRQQAAPPQVMLA